MSRFLGTGKLVRLALRRDRAKLPIWILSITAIVGVSVPALTEVYGTMESQIAYAANMGNSAIGRAFGGVPDGPSMGTIAMIEMFAFTAVLMAFMSTTAVVRHTRASEESGAAELIGSTVMGRYAGLLAAIIVATGANLITGVFIAALVIQIKDFNFVESLGFGMALAMVGIIFVAIAAVAAQLSSSGRGANGLSTMAIGIAFLLRAVGDGFAKVNPDGLSANSGFATWLSPIGLGYQIFPFTQQRWWIFGLLILIAVALAVLAFYLLVKRDIGSGLLPERRGPAHANHSLLSLSGLAWRLQRVTMFWWIVFFIIFGLVFGGMANDFQDIINSTEVAAQYFGDGDGNIMNAFFGYMILYGAVTAVGYGLMSLLKMRSEESSGRLESVLGTSSDRRKWMLSHIGISLIGIVLLMFFIIIASLAMFKVTGGNLDLTKGAFEQGLLQIPAILLLSSVAILTFGLVPRFSVGISWMIFILVMVIIQFGPLLELPQWLLNLSPFSHTPQIIGAEISWTPLLIMSLITVLFTAFGLYLFRQRDLDLE